MTSRLTTTLSPTPTCWKKTFATFNLCRPRSGSIRLKLALIAINLLADIKGHFFEVCARDADSLGEIEVRPVCMHDVKYPWRPTASLDWSGPGEASIYRQSETSTYNMIRHTLENEKFPGKGYNALMRLFHG